MAKRSKNFSFKKYSDDAYDHLLKTYKEENLDMGAIHDALISKIAEGITIAPEVLQNLALKRSDTIIQTLTTKYKIAPERLIKNEPQTSDAIREEWVGCPISISN